jgi:septum formation protein
LNDVTSSIVLASESAARQRLLRAAGVPFITEPARIDEAAIKAGLQAEGASAEAAAEALAELKGQRVSLRHPGRMVIAADQLLVCGEQWFDKPAGMAEAAQQLAALSGKTHRLATAVVAVRDGARLWHHRESPRLTLRQLDSGEIRRYLDSAGPAVLGSVGAYHLEGLGVRLMARVEGDHFAIQGLPLLPLLDFLRNHGLAG